jgi:glycine cleavage system H lipoate-binding protein/ABC-type phosphate transport system substrate-binding protein
MRTRILTTVVLLLLIVSGARSQNAENPAINDQVKIFTTPEMRNLTEVWIAKYLQTNTDFNFELTPVSRADIKDKITGDQSIGIVMQQADVSSTIGEMWQLPLGREVVVTVFNKANPLAKELTETGVSANELATVFQNNDKNRGTLADNKNRRNLNFYVLDEPEVKLSVAKFLEVDPTEISTLEALSQDKFLKAVQSDINAIGFCRLSAITNLEQKDFAENIALLPIDRNKNGRLDYYENIYASSEQFERSVWIGKYPHSMIYNIYAVSSAFPENAEINNFLSWLTSSGQVLVAQNGYTELVHSEKQSNLEKLTPPVLMAEYESASTGSAAFFRIFVAVLGLLLVFVIVRYFIRKQKAKAPLLNKTRYVKLLNEASLDFPNGLYFDKTHTWVFMEEGGRVKMGVDDFISNVTGNYTRLIMKSPGEKVKRMEPVVTLIRKGKQITLNSPVSGTIKEINESLVADPFMINNEPYGEGWVYKIEPSNWLRETQFFKMGSSYREWIIGEFSRLKDFLACSLNIMNLEGGKPAFQEGGELMLHPLKDLDPRVWEDFQNYFINTADTH